MPAAVGQLHRLHSHAHFAACYSTSPISMGSLLSRVYHYHRQTDLRCSFPPQKDTQNRQYRSSLFQNIKLNSDGFGSWASLRVYCEAPYLPDVTGLYDASALFLRIRGIFFREHYIEKP